MGRPPFLAEGTLGKTCVNCSESLVGAQRVYCTTCGPLRKTTEHGRRKRREWYHRDPRKVMLQSCKQTAKKKDLPFSLTLDDILIPARCPVFGTRLEVATGDRDDNSPSIDRVIPALGYVPGNVRVISWRANRIKSDATQEDLRAILHYLNSL